MKLVRRAGAALGVLLLLLVGALLYDVLDARGSANRARDELAAGMDAVAEGDLDATVAHVTEADAAIDSAVAATTRPMWGVGERLPVLERALPAARDTIAVADEGLEIASAMVAEIEEVSRPDGGSRIRDETGRIDLDPLMAAASDVAAIDTSGLETALEVLEAWSPAGLPDEIVDGREQALAEGRQLLETTGDLQSIARILPGFLGTDEPREYLLAMQNVAELRGTGGLVGFFATVRIGDGVMELTDPQRYEVLDQRGAGSRAVDDSWLPEGFLQRYAGTQTTTFLANANLDPDFPTVAEIMLELYDAENGRRPDGVIAMDPIGLSYAHLSIGPVAIPKGFPTKGIPNPLPAHLIAKTLMIDAYEVFGGPSQIRKDYLELVARTAFQNVASGRWSALAMLGRLGEATRGGHLKLYSTNEEEQAVLTELGLAGQLEQPEGADLVAVTANNSAGNKSDAHVAHRLTGELRLFEGHDGALRRSAALTISVVNPLPTRGRDIYIIGSSDPNTGFQQFFAGPKGLNRTWFTVWMPPASEQIAIVGSDGERRDDPRVTQLHDLKAVDYVMETPSKTTRSFRASYEGPAPVAASDDGTIRYRMLLQRQTKAVPDRLDLRVVVPEGWGVRTVSVEGGGTGHRFGPDGPPGPPVSAQTKVDGRAVHITGDMTDDAVIEMTLTSPAS